MPTTLKNEAAIVGVGQTEYSKNSGRSEVQLACEATKAAILDAGQLEEYRLIVKELREQAMEEFRRRQGE